MDKTCYIRINNHLTVGPISKSEIEDVKDLAESHPDLHKQPIAHLLPSNTDTIITVEELKAIVS